MLATPCLTPRLLLTFSSVLLLGISASPAKPSNNAPPATAPKGKVSMKTAPAQGAPTAPKATAAPKAKVVADSAAIPSAKPVKPDRFAAEEELSPVPATGPLNLQQLIDLALYSNMDILQARRKLEIARAERLAAVTLKDPELRLSYSSQVDVEVGEPFSEYSSGFTTTSGTETDTRRYHGSSSTNGLPATPTSRYQIESGHFRETRYRRVEKEVTPGATVDKVVTKEYESTNTTSNSHRNRNSNKIDNKGLPENEIESDSISRNNKQKLVSKTTTYVHHRDTTTPERQWGLALRFPFPNPWEIRPRIRAAEAEIKAADYDSKAVENEIIAKVRAVYEELSYYDALSKSLKKLGEKRQEFTDYARANAMDKLAGAAGSSSNARIKSLQAKMKADELRRQLGIITGLNDLNRISIPPNFRHRVVDLSALNKDYLLQMASVYRMDLHTLHAKNEAARAEFSKERASRFPFLGYFQGGYGAQVDRAGRDANEWTLGIGISIPLWSNLYNKTEKVPEAEARALSREIGRLQGNIEADITSSLQSLKAAQETMALAEKEFTALELLMKNEARGGAGFSKNPQEVLNEAEEMVLELNLQRLELHRSYNEAVQNLERALGTRLEKVLQPQK